MNFLKQAASKAGAALQNAQASRAEAAAAAAAAPTATPVASTVSPSAGSKDAGSTSGDDKELQRQHTYTESDGIRTALCELCSVPTRSFAVCADVQSVFSLQVSSPLWRRVRRSCRCPSKWWDTADTKRGGALHCVLS